MKCGLYVRIVYFSLSVPTFVHTLENVLPHSNEHALEGTLDEINLRDTFLYPLFAFNDAYASVEGITLRIGGTFVERCVA